MNRQEALKTFGPMALKILGRPAKERAATYAADYLNRRRAKQRGEAVVVSETAPAQTANNRLLVVGGSAGLAGLVLGLALGFFLGRR